MISVADAAGVSPLRAQLNISADPKVSVTPDKAFLAFELPIKDSKESVQVDEQGRLRINHKDQVLLDVHPSTTWLRCKPWRAAANTVWSIAHWAPTPPLRQADSAEPRRRRHPR